MGAGIKCQFELLMLSKKLLCVVGIDVEQQLLQFGMFHFMSLQQLCLDEQAPNSQIGTK